MINRLTAQRDAEFERLLTALATEDWRPRALCDRRAGRWQARASAPTAWQACLAMAAMTALAMIGFALTLFRGIR